MVPAADRDADRAVDLYMALENIVGVVNAAAPLDGRVRVRARARLRLLVCAAARRCSSPARTWSRRSSRSTSASSSARSWCSRSWSRRCQLLFRYVVAERIGTIILSALVAHTAWHWVDRAREHAARVQLARARRRDACPRAPMGHRRARHRRYRAAHQGTGVSSTEGRRVSALAPKPGNLWKSALTP